MVDMRRALLLIVGAVIAPAAFGQTVLDGAYIREHAATRRTVPYVHLREGDVQWHRRVWRTIDLRQKLNLALHYPAVPTNGRKSLFDAIMSAVREGGVNVYHPGVLLQDDDFRRVMTTDERTNLLERSDTVQTASLENPDSTISVVTTTSLTSDQVTRFRLKEDWHFDKQRGKVDIRIIGLAPMREVRSESGEVLGHAPLFWLYYPELRYYLANQEVFSSGNEAQRITFEQLFTKRRFASTIDKVSNVHDRGSSAYLAGVDALLVGERIKHDLFAYEHDLWNW